MLLDRADQKIHIFHVVPVPVFYVAWFRAVTSFETVWIELPPYAEQPEPWHTPTDALSIFAGKTEKGNMIIL